MTAVDILTPGRQIKTNDLQVVGANIVGGAALLQGQVTTMVADIFLARPVAELAVRLRIYDAGGECAFASKLYKKGSFENGNHSIDFHFITALQKGTYAASFEFQELQAPALTIPNEKGILGLHNLFLEFDVVANESDEALESEAQGELGYLQLPTEVNIVSRSVDRFDHIAFPDSAPTAQFPWPLSEKPLEWNEFTSVIEKVLHHSRKHRFSNQSFVGSTLSPLLSDYELDPTTPPMRTNVGQASERGLTTTGHAGFLLFGPYLSVIPGKYWVRISGIVGLGGAEGVTIDVTAKLGTLTLAREKLATTLCGILDTKIYFEVLPSGHVDLEVRVQVDAADEIVIKSITFTSAENAINDYLNGNVRRRAVDFLARARADWLESCDNWALVYCPNLNWAPFIMAICDHLQQEGISWLLVAANDLKEDLLPIREYPSKIRSIRLENISSLPKQFSCKTLVVHSFGYQDETYTLLKRFPEAHLRIYADGLTNVAVNAIDKIAPVDAVYYFDSLPVTEFFPIKETAWFKYKQKSHVIDATNISKYWKLLAKNIQLHDLIAVTEPENYVVVYLRHWSAGVYEAFNQEDISNSIALTLVKQGVTSEIVIIKPDPRVDVNMHRLITTNLCENGFRTLELEDLVRDCGNDPEIAKLPAEILFSKGYLLRAKMHFVLDSTMGYSIALNPEIIRPTKVAFGIHGDAMPVWEGTAGANHIYRHVECVSAMILKSKAVGIVNALDCSTRSLKVIELLPKKSKSRRKS